MSEVLVPYGDDMKDTAVLLLAAAEDKGYEPYVVRHQPEDFGFRVPEDVAEAAKVKPEPKKAPAKKAPAKKAAAKKAAASKDKG